MRVHLHDAGAGRAWFGAGAVMGLCAVAFAAVSAHLPERMLHAGGREALRAAVQMLGWHAAALLACGLWLRQGGRIAVHLAGACFVAGAVCFTVGVAVPVLGGPHLGILAPTGGSLLMLGWASLAVSALL
ncbi:DUF423 domain-containing protein [Lichenicoccus sp.]|uniref:DUF423 domain-containing protein n=1 Tax=Lichenicoccus sp. TaxID=2781899 RepID=UPI003D11370E